MSARPWSAACDGIMNILFVTLWLLELGETLRSCQLCICVHFCAISLDRHYWLRARTAITRVVLGVSRHTRGQTYPPHKRTGSIRGPLSSYR